MPQRTTVEAVLAICPTESTDISGPMRAGSLLTDRAYSDLVDEESELVERYCVAHFVAIMDPRATESRFEGIQQKFEIAESGVGLKETRFGRQAIALDTTGTLKRLGAGKAFIEGF